MSLSLSDAIVRGIVAGLRQPVQDLLKAFGPVLDRNEEPYSYVFEFADATTTVANAAQREISVGFENAAYFVVTSREYYAVPASGTNIDAMVTVQLAGSTHRWENREVIVQAAYGTGIRPHFLPKPHLVLPGSTITMTLRNISGVTLNRAQIVLNGYRIFSEQALGWLMRA